MIGRVLLKKRQLRRGLKPSGVARLDFGTKFPELVSGYDAIFLRLSVATLT